MIELYIIRHGPAGQHIANKKLDEARTLDKKGKKKVKDIAKGLKELGVTFDKIITSPLVRAVETAEIISAYCGASDEVIVSELLMPEASFDELIKYLNGLKVAKVAIVGHEPFLSSFASFCLAKSKTSFITLKKGGVLLLDVENTLKPGRCMLSWLMKPREIIGESHA